jgi:hypothetical protein
MTNYEQQGYERCELDEQFSVFVGRLPEERLRKGLKKIAGCSRNYLFWFLCISSMSCLSDILLSCSAV